MVPRPHRRLHRRLLDPRGRHPRVDYTEHEFCLLLAGKVRLTDQDGHVDDYGMGDGFVIPMGFKGTWETLKPVRKWYVIWQPK